MSNQFRRGRARDRASTVAFNNRAPRAEQTQALAELQKSYMPHDSDLAPMAAINQFIAMTEEHLAKAVDPSMAPYSSVRAKSGDRGMKSVQIDQFSLNMQGEYWERPSLLSFDALRNVADQVPILSAVILTRQRQVQRFCSVNESDNDLPGYEIRHADKDHRLTRSEQEAIQKMHRFIANCGWETKPRERKKMGREAFPQLMAKLTRDSLTLDAAPIELEWKKDKSLGIDGFYAVDGATIRLTTEAGYRGDPDVRYLQVVQGNICTPYTYDDLIYETRNPRSNVITCGYGQSEIELLVKVVTGYLNAMTYNIKGFDSNAIPKGMLHLVGNYDQRDLAAFKRYWNQMVRGINNQWSLPVMVAKDEGSKASFEKFGVEFNEMYFAKWMTFLTSLICAIYGISPAEINFDSFSGGSTSPLSGSDTEEKLTASKDSGLRPLLSYFQGLLTDNVVGEFSENLVFRWTGLDPEDKDKRHERNKLTMTVDEMRSRDGLPKHPDPKMGAAPVNPALMQVYMTGLQPEEGEDGEGGADAGQPAMKDGKDGKPAAAGKDKGGKPAEAAPAGVGSDFDFGKSFGLPPILTAQELI